MAQKRAYEKSPCFQRKAVGINDIRLGHYGTPGAQIVKQVMVAGMRADDGRSEASEQDLEPPREPSFDEVTYEATVMLAEGDGGIRGDRLAVRDGAGNTPPSDFSRTDGMADNPVLRRAA